MACTGDIRTLLDWENYTTANTANACFYRLFYECKQLVTAPTLPATTLAEYCYSEMFYGCTSLNSITMLATDISAKGCLSSWVTGVSSSGTFYKNSEATWDVTGTSGIPEGWTVVNK